MTAFKAQAHMRQYKQDLKISLVSPTFVDTTDADGFPILKVTASSETFFAKIETLGNAGRVNAVGLPQQAYSPHKCTLLQDSTITSRNVKYRSIARAMLMGMRLDIYEVNPLPSDYDLTGATLVSSIEPDDINKLTDSQ